MWKGYKPIITLWFFLKQFVNRWTLSIETINQSTRRGKLIDIS